MVRKSKSGGHEVIFIQSGNGEEAKIFCHKYQIKGIYLHSTDQIRGVRDGIIIQIGNYYNNKEWDEIVSLAIHREFKIFKQ